MLLTIIALETLSRLCGSLLIDGFFYLFILFYFFIRAIKYTVCCLLFFFFNNIHMNTYLQHYELQQV